MRALILGCLFGALGGAVYAWRNLGTNTSGNATTCPAG